MKTIRMKQTNEVMDLELERMLNQNNVNRHLEQERAEDAAYAAAVQRRKLRTACRFMFASGVCAVLGMVYGFAGEPFLAIAGLTFAVVMAYEADQV